MDRFLNGCFVPLVQTCFLNVGRRVIPMMARESLLNLSAAAVAMHVTKTAYIHENVELELLAGVE